VRIQKINALIQKHKPDIVFLQEVLRDMVEHFLKLDGYPHHFGATFQHPYGTLILSRLPCIRYDRISLPNTESNRNFLMVEIFLPSEQTMIVGTFHCDSVFGKIGSEQEMLKLDQLSFIGSILEDKPYVIAGDTNLIDNGKTTIETLNELDSPATYNKNRFDRIFVSSGITTSPVEVIGDATHSDHRGLVVSINLPEQ
jgi:endonuclease/exonuclease/phosphatase family metal-dependent hydrolase